jgi:hypothetical protein
MIRTTLTTALGTALLFMTASANANAQQNCAAYDKCCMNSEKARLQCFQPYQDLFDSCLPILGPDLCSRLIYEPLYQLCEQQHQRRLDLCDSKFPGCKNAVPKDELLA